MVNMEIIIHISCRSDLRIATKLTDSRESEFPPTNQNVKLIVKSTIMYFLQPKVGKYILARIDNT